MEEQMNMVFPDYKWYIEPIKGWRVQLEERPCLWNRIWYRLIFGWEFKKI